MAQETTTTSATGAINASLVQPVIIQALSERPGLAVRVCREFSLVGQPTGTAKIPTQTSYWGAPGDRGAGVDTDFDGVQAQDAGNSEFALSSVTINTPEYVIAHAVSKSVEEDGAALLSLMVGSMLGVLQLCLDDDLIALAVGLSQGVGTTNTDMSLANALDATHGIISRGANTDAMEYLLDPEQVANIRAVALSTNAAASVYSAAADRLIGLDRTSTAERGQGRVLMLDGCLVTQSGLTDTVGSEDVAGMAFCPTTANNDLTGATTFGLAWKRLPELEMQYFAKGRVTDVVMSMRAGVAELQDGSGTKIVTDKP